MGKKRSAACNTNAAFCASYVFRSLSINLGMEDTWHCCEPYGSGEPGMDTKKVLDRVQYIIGTGSSVYQNEFGKPIEAVSRPWR